MKNQKNQTKNSLLLLTIVALVAILLSSCNRECKDLTSKELSITGPIQGVIIDGPWEVNIAQDSATNSAVIEYCSSREGKITAELLGGYLHLKVRGGYPFKVLRANINATSLEKIEASGAVDMRTSGYFCGLNDIALSGASTLNGLLGEGHSITLALSGASTVKGFTFTGNSFNANLSGASDAKFSSKNLEYCTVDCSGASKLAGSGYAAKTSFTGSGASDIETLSLQSENLDIDLSGASTATVWVNNTIKGRLEGASTLKYKGTKDVGGVTISGGSKLICLD
jgi:hypothetical protein